MTGAWSLGPLPLRACRSTHAALTRPATGCAGQHQVDPHPEVLVEHPGPVVPVGEDALAGPAVADDVVQAERLQLGQSRSLGRRDVRLPDVGVGIEDVVVGGRDVHVAAHDRRLGACGDRVAQRRQPGELVLVVLGARDAPVGHVDRDDPDPAAGGRDRARLGVREARDAREPRDHVVQPDARQDRDPVPGRLTVDGDLVAARGELGVEQIAKGVVGELGLLEADHVGLRSSSQGSRRGTRCLTELTFQVATRTDLRSRGG